MLHCNPMIVGAELRYAASPRFSRLESGGVGWVDTDATRREFVAALQSRRETMTPRRRSSARDRSSRDSS